MEEPARTLFGDWSPGIGDPTPMGWLTVVAYFAASAACFAASARARSASTRVLAERRVGALWLVLGVFLAALGVNKQLDLQSLLTEIGRYLAHTQGWYEERRAVQARFILVVFGLALVAGAALVWVSRGHLQRLATALAGAVFLLAFVLVRASSFHHVDTLIRTELVGVRMNWVLELSGIGLIGFAALRDRPCVPRRRERRSGSALL